MPTILVVDDEAVDRELARRCLASIEDLELCQAGDGEEALKLVAVQPPDLILTDLRMPVLDGLELVTKIRERHPTIPVILMTSRGSEQIAVRALRSGAASYVPKSDLRASLADTVREVLEIAEAGRSRRRVLTFLRESESRFELDTDPALIAPLVGFLTEGLARLGFDSESFRTQMGMALMEALSNAIIHGNLEVGSEMRDRGTGEYYELIRRRRGEEPYSRRKVRCVARESPRRVEYVIEDEGPGFDPASLPDPESPENLMHVRGRGLLLIRTFMDSVRHNGKGNQITMIKSGPEGR